MKHLMIVVLVVPMLGTSLLAQEQMILPVAQEMPTLQDCADITEPSERRACTDEKTSACVADLKMPSEAHAAGVERFLVVQFVVDEKGKTTDHQVLDDPGFGMGEAAVKALKKCGKWVAGKNRGEAVKVRVSVSVEFKVPEAAEPVAPKPDVYVVVDQKPRFAGCAMDDDQEAGRCTFERVIQHMTENLKYPEMARKNNVTGEVIVKFIVDEQGAVTNARVEKGIGGGCDEEALRVVNAMPSWIPGLVNGENVKVEMMLPFKFDVPTEKE